MNPAKSPALETRGKLKAPKAEPFSAVVPTGESPKDAELRRQMIEYNMRDVGSVVAEIDLEEKGSEPWSEGEEEQDLDEDDDDNYGEEEEGSQHGSSTDEDEDRFGRSNRRVLDDNYLNEMLALEKKLNSMTLRNIGPDSRASKSTEGDLKDEEVNTNTQNNNAHQDAKIPLTKEVRFASKLDIQDSSSPATSHILDSHSGNSERRLIQSPINDRAPLGEPSKTPQSTQKISRFKSGRNGLSAENSKLTSRPAATLPGKGLNPPKSSTGVEKSLRKPTSTPAVASIPSSPPQPPSGPHAATVIERPYSSTSTTTPTEPDELDPSLLQQQVATEYHSMRNRMIQRQGGFLASAAEEANDGRVELEEEGGERKVSRFKAAKLRMR